MTRGSTTMIERDGDWLVASCPELPRASGPGTAKEEAGRSLADAIAPIPADRGERIGR